VRDEIEAELLEQRADHRAAMPLPPSTTTRSGLTRPGEMNCSAAAWNSS